MKIFLYVGEVQVDALSEDQLQVIADRFSEAVSAFCHSARIGGEDGPG